LLFIDEVVLTPEALRCLRQAGRVASEVRRLGAHKIVAGARLRDVCEEVEAQILKRGAHPAFPVQTSRNDIAAHYCPSPTEETVYEDGDLAKLDIGVHVDGWVVDTAITVNVGDHPERRIFIQAAEAALAAAIEAARAGVAVRTLSAAIERTLRSYRLHPMRNLCGHGVGHYLVHTPPPIPNSPEPNEVFLPTHAVIAIEPFATDGQGLVAERGKPEVFRVDPERLPPQNNDEPRLFRKLRAFRGLPFARRQLRDFSREETEATLDLLRLRGSLTSYPPLVERGGRPVAQAEHTLYLGPEGTEVLTA
jgi:methionyl aminopeptidase